MEISNPPPWKSEFKYCISILDAEVSKHKENLLSLIHHKHRVIVYTYETNIYINEDDYDSVVSYTYLFDSIS